MKSQKIISLNPSKNYEIIGEIDSFTHHEIDRAITNAREAQPAWAGLAIGERVTFLERVYQECIRKKDAIRSIMSQEMGMPIAVCDTIDIDPGLRYLRGYLDYAERWLASEIVYEDAYEIHYLYYEPKGVAGVSVPWNYPFSNFIWGVMQNLVVGNTVVFKHSEDCIFTSTLLEEIMQTAQLPHGVFSTVYGTGVEVGDYLMNGALDLIWCTGSTGVGKHLYQVAAKKLIPAVLELGGSAAGIVFEDADLDITIESLYNNRFLNSGQTCDGLKRLMVHTTIFDEVVTTLHKIVSSKKVGPASDPTTDIGPLVAERQVITLEEQVNDAIQKGAKVIIGAQRPHGLQGAYYAPTILTQITFDMKVWKEEVFGPVLPVVPFTTQEEAISLANDSIYGLGGFVYTQDTQRAIQVSRLLQTGNVNVNAANYVIPQDPFGGYKQSGIGREHGQTGLKELTSLKIIALKK